MIQKYVKKLVTSRTVDHKDLEQQVFIIIRFSMLLKHKNKWKAGENSETWFQYKENILSEKRLKFRMKLFKEITLPSLVGQSVDFDKNNVKVIVATSEELPKEYMQNLDGISKKYPWFEVLKTSEDFAGFKKYLLYRLAEKKQSVNVATIRLDDDDALSKDFVSRVLEYQKKSINGYALTFANGYAGVYSTDSERIVSFKEYFYSKFSAGLTYFDRYNPVDKGFEHKYGTVYSLGSHVEVDKKVPLIVDPRGRGFIRTIHEEADTYENWVHKVPKMKDVRIDEVIDKFSLSESIIN